MKFKGYNFIPLFYVESQYLYKELLQIQQPKSKHWAIAW